MNTIQSCLHAYAYLPLVGAVFAERRNSPVGDGFFDFHHSDAGPCLFIGRWSFDFNAGQPLWGVPLLVVAGLGKFATDAACAGVRMAWGHSAGRFSRLVR